MKSAVIIDDVFDRLGLILFSILTLPVFVASSVIVIFDMIEENI